MLLLSMFVWPKMGYVQGKIGLTRQFVGTSREIICSPVPFPAFWHQIQY